MQQEQVEGNLMTGFGWVDQGTADTVEKKLKSKNIALILKAKWINIYFNT